MGKAIDFPASHMSSTPVAYRPKAARGKTDASIYAVCSCVAAEEAYGQCVETGRLGRKVRSFLNPYSGAFKICTSICSVFVVEAIIKIVGAVAAWRNV